MKQANRSGAQFAVIVGESELAERTVVVKPMNGGEQFTVSREEFTRMIEHDELVPGTKSSDSEQTSQEPQES